MKLQSRLLFFFVVISLVISLSIDKPKIAVCVLSHGSILRVCDNPLFLYASDNNMQVSPIIIHNDDNSMNYYKDIDNIYDNLKSKITSLGGNVQVIKGDIISNLKNHIDSIKKESNNDVDINLLYVKTPLEPIKSSLEEIMKCIKDVNIIPLDDNLIYDKITNDIVPQSSTDLSNFLFTKYENKLYRNLEKTVKKPVMIPKINYYNNNNNNNKNNDKPKSLFGEDLAIKLLTDYIKLGDREFSYKYAEDYINNASTSEDHKKSLYCLTSEGSNIWGGNYDTKYFQGEVFSGLMNSLISLGCVSPNLVIHARSELFNARERLGLEIPVVDRIKNEIIRKDWHRKLASISSSADSNRDDMDWKIQYTNFRGYIQREGTMISKSSSSDKPLIFLIHGFGGSLQQMTSLAVNLYPDFDVAAIDMLGFGHSEKAPLSYNQYFWRDQIVDFVKRIAGSERKNVLIFGNSIGGFISTAACASLALEYEQNSKMGVNPKGLVLCNSAGDLASDLEGVVIDEKSLFKKYEGPPSEFLRVFGKVIFSLLQPRIEKTCEWLYPSNIEPVKDLAKNILRDSCDPGAPDVIAAGGKLPTPEPMSSLLNKYRGPTLIAQGADDPLNDAKDRARQFGEIRDGIDVDLLKLGHCAFHENPQLVSSSIKKWAIKNSLLSSSNVNTNAVKSILV